MGLGVMVVTGHGQRGGSASLLLHQPAHTACTRYCCQPARLPASQLGVSPNQTPSLSMQEMLDFCAAANPPITCEIGGCTGGGWEVAKHPTNTLPPKQHGHCSTRRCSK